MEITHVYRLAIALNKGNLVKLCVSVQKKFTQRKMTNVTNV